ncbi:DNA polymerase [Hoyosella rhizosphaerae]|uniref:DNA polymerase n=1 Tax=Hoyosella rhizosphaerae TaxID=1755582 RepID=A0A916UAN6_9ACTN|nr:DNA polymerase [Hoyosella rhizosphaerae]
MFHNDVDRDARRFDAVIVALDAVAAHTELLRPGLALLPVKGLARYHGGESAAAEILIDAVAEVGQECQIGIADQIFTAAIAARYGHIVPPGTDAQYLAPRRIAELAAEPSLAGGERAELTTLLHRLGVRTIGQFAAISPRHIASRFGNDAVCAHRRARGEPDRPPSGQPLPPNLDVEHHCEPTIERIDMAAFAGRAIAANLHDILVRAGVACTKLAIHARTEHGEEHTRVWRCSEPLTATSTADRIRWQLDGWLTSRSAKAPTAGIANIRLEPLEVVAAGELQLGLWGEVGESEERAHRALTRVQGLLGGDAVLVATPGGGRNLATRLQYTTHSDEPVAQTTLHQPWPGQMLPPLPSWIPLKQPDAHLHCEQGREIYVTGRGFLSGEPHTVAWGGESHAVVGWSGPWCVDDAWWDHAAAQRSARIQVLTRAGKALLLASTEQLWRVEGIWE